jgi:hypothetical protein
VIECGAGCDYRVAAEIALGPAAELVEPGARPAESPPRK